jgi:hypothetical protein
MLNLSLFFHFFIFNQLDNDHWSWLKFKNEDKKNKMWPVGDARLRRSQTQLEGHLVLSDGAEADLERPPRRPDKCWASLKMLLGNKNSNLKNQTKKE